MGHLGIGLRQRLSTWPVITRLSTFPALVCWRDSVKQRGAGIDLDCPSFRKQSSHSENNFLPYIFEDVLILRMTSSILSTVTPPSCAFLLVLHITYFRKHCSIVQSLGTLFLHQSQPWTSLVLPTKQMKKSQTCTKPIASSAKSKDALAMVTGTLLRFDCEVFLINILFKR